MTEQERLDRISEGLLWYDTDEYLAHQAKVKDLMYDFNMSKPSETEKRAGRIWEMFGSVGKDVWINQPLTLAVGSTVTIGDGTYINSGMTFIDDYKITIGKGCLFGTNVTLCTTGHPIDPEERAKGSMYSFPITIGDGAWIGVGAIILPGITIGEYAVIGAGSVVTKDIPAYTIAAGNPCKPIRKIDDHDKEYYFKEHRFKMSNVERRDRELVYISDDEVFADYHVHTYYSDDSKTPMEKQVERAISLGLREICFTDHVDYGIKRDWDDPRGVEYRKDGPGETEREALANVDYPRYFKEIEELKRKYKDQIIIRAGLEFGIQTITIPQYDKLYSKYGDKLDFVLLSVHQVDNQELWTQDFQRGKTQEEYNRRYYEEILAVINQFKNYDVLAHLDLITRYDKNGIYPFEKVQDIIKEILKIIIAEGKGLELNTSSWRYGLSDTQPSRDILRLYKDLGGKYITLGSDAHTPEYMAAHFEDAKDILENEIGIYLLRIPDRR